MNKLTRTSLLALMTIAAMAGLFFACEKTEPESVVTDESQGFLQLSEDYNSACPSMEDLGILSKGLERLPTFSDIDELLSKTNAKNLRMTESLFEECVSFFRPNKFRKRKVVPGEFGNVDSFSRTLSYLLNFKRPGKTDCYAEIQTYCLNKYGTGLLNDSQISSTLNHFSENVKVDPDDLKYGDIITWGPNGGGGVGVFVGRANGGRITYICPDAGGKGDDNRATCGSDELRQCYRVLESKNF